MKAMLDVRRPMGKGNFEIGLGWFLFGDVVWHDGGTGGFQSFAGYNPKARTGVVALSNAFTPGGVSDIAMHLLNPKTPLSNFDPPEQHTRIVVDLDVLDRYTGRYELPDRVLEITRDGDRLFAQVTSVGGKRIAGPVFEMSAEDERNFSAKLIGGRISFEADSDGRATGLIMHRTDRGPVSGSRLP
jgi:CubicO group peptidase (beta-lactamase class C family)